jgi:hypothetical protein
VPVDYDPFASTQTDSANSPVPVDYDPFAAAPAPAAAAPVVAPSFGRKQTKPFQVFDESRSFKMPGAEMESYFATPKGGQKAVDISTGLASGAAQTVTGAGELIPGDIGAASARGTKALRKIGDPESQFVGGLTSGFLLPGGVITKGAKLGTEGATALSNIVRGFGAGGATGGIYGALTPTGEEKPGKRYGEKLLGTALGVVIVGPLGAVAGAFAPRGTNPSDLLRNYASSIKESGFAKDIVDGFASAEKTIQTQLEKTIRNLERSASKQISGLYSELNNNLFSLYQNAGEQAKMVLKQGGAKAQQTADAIMAAAEQQIQRATSLAQEAANRATTRATTAEAKLKNIGDPSKELTDVAAPLRNQTVARQTKIAADQKAADDVLRRARNDIVVANEAKGITLDQMPSYQKIAEKTAPFDPARSPDIIQNTDTSKLNLYSKLRDAVLNKRVELSKDQAEIARGLGYEVAQDGSKFYRTFRTGFEAADDFRRFVGEIFKKDIEGYQAISAIEKQEIYGLLSRLQEEYVGATAQKSLQANWAAASKALDALESKSGKTLLQLEEGTQAFNKPAAELPGYFFSSRDRVQTAIDLSDDPAAVRKVAGDYLANQLRSKDSASVQKFLNDSRNSDWLSHPLLKDLKTEVGQYAQRLARAETAQAAATKLTAAPIKTDKGRTTRGEFQRQQAEVAETTAKDVGLSAAKEAEQIRVGAGELGKQEQGVVQQKVADIRKQTDQQVKDAQKAFASAKSTPQIKQELQGLKEYADNVLLAEENAAKKGIESTTLTYTTLISEMKQFLNARAKDGTIPKDILIREVEKLDRIAATQSKQVKSQLLREELKTLAGDFGAVAMGRVGRIPSLLKTSGRVLGGGL